MSQDRLSYAIASGGLALPETGRIALIGAPGDAPLGALDPARLDVVQSFAPDHAAWQRRGVNAVTEAQGRYAVAIVTLPRARDLAEDHIARASTLADLVVVDGAKTDGIEAIAKALRGRLSVRGQVSKAHGKCLWFTGGVDLSDWLHAPRTLPDGEITAPGVFSADGPDPASEALAAALPATLKGRFADLGAGWGWLSKRILTRVDIKDLHLVEADKTALDCARQNVTDPRALFHWDDATIWTPPQPLDGVIMNPPFHQGRKADPQLGRAFIASAARILAPHGQLWLVANRHLPYETALAESFRDTSEIGDDSRFKILHAARPTRQRR